MLHRQVISNIEIGVERTLVGALSWSSTVDIDFKLDEHTTRQSLHRAVNRIQFDGNSTYTSEALRQLRLTMFQLRTPRPQSLVAQKVAIVITDGNSNVFPENTAPEAVRLHQAGVHVITVSVGTLTNQNELRAIATRRAQRNMFHVDSYSDLVAIYMQVIKAFSNGRSVTSTRSNSYANYIILC